MSGNTFRVDNSISHLYKITNKNTGEYYIGKHNGWSQKKSGGGLYWGSGDRLKNQVRKYGKQNFNYEILCYGTPEYIFEVEQKYVTIELIEQDEKCLNLMTGGYGRKEYSKESCLKISKKLTGRKFDLERRNNMSKSKIGNKYALGYKWTEEEKNNLKKSRAKQIIPKEAYEKSSKTMSTLTWMNDGTRSYRVRPEKLQAAKENGYLLGRLISFVDDKYKEQLRNKTKSQWQKVKETGHNGNLIKVN
jgi:hypothetical protein